MYSLYKLSLAVVVIVCFGAVVARKGTGGTTLKKSKPARRTTAAPDYCSRDCSLDKKPVCGSDDKDYPSHCQLRKESCLMKSGVTLQNRGSCDCPETCTKDYKPVCGSNDKTFHNICQLRKLACRLKGKKVNITLLKKGPCKPWKSNHCPESCSDIWAPVCAMDGKTYSSVCSMKLKSCKSSQRIGLKKIGHCKNHHCPDHCPENHRPLCANDGKVYENECEMRLKACRTKKVKELKRSSKKKLCSNKCVHKCPAHDNKVCGSDSITYKNECELHRKNCQLKRKVYILKKGPCDSSGIIIMAKRKTDHGDKLYVIDQNHNGQDTHVLLSMIIWFLILI